MRERIPAVYILASLTRGTIYTGVTSDPLSRLWQHREGVGGGFSGEYNVKRLVYIEFLGDMEHAIRREKQLKSWKRQWKIALIEKNNPTWRDLALDYGFESLAELRRGHMDPGSSPG